MEFLKRKILLLLFYVAMGIMVISAVIFIVPAYNNYCKAKSRLDSLKLELNRKKNECMKLQEDVYKLTHDPKYVEKVAREKFGLCRKGEIIYKYKPDKR